MQLVACFGHTVTWPVHTVAAVPPEQRVGSALAVHMVAWIGQDVTFVGHWVATFAHWVSCTGQLVNTGVAGHTVTAVVAHTEAVAGQVVLATGQAVAACGKIVGLIA